MVVIMSCIMVMRLPGAALRGWGRVVMPGASASSTKRLPLTASVPLIWASLASRPCPTMNTRSALPSVRDLLRREGGAVLRHAARQQQLRLAGLAHHGGDDAVHRHDGGNDLGRRKGRAGGKAGGKGSQDKAHLDLLMLCYNITYPRSVTAVKPDDVVSGCGSMGELRSRPDLPDGGIMNLDVSIGAALLAGAISFLSPCVLPLVPPYLCFITGTSLEELVDHKARPREERRRTLLAALLFVLGFSTVFIIAGRQRLLARQPAAHGTRTPGGGLRLLLQPDHHGGRASSSSPWGCISSGSSACSGSRARCATSTRSIRAACSAPISSALPSPSAGRPASARCWAPS